MATTFAPVTPHPWLPQDSLSTEAVQHLSAKLTQDAGLVLPASLSRDRAPTQSEVHQYLSELLCRAPAVFLERYGMKLSAEELGWFQPMRGVYEINHWVTQLQNTLQAASSQEGKLTAQAKNRRLAHMLRLTESGEYFSEDAMRDRAPLLYHQLIGRFTGGPAPPARERLSESLLRQSKDAAFAERLAVEIEDEASDVDVDDNEGSITQQLPVTVKTTQDLQMDMCEGLETESTEAEEDTAMPTPRHDASSSDDDSSDDEVHRSRKLWGAYTTQQPAEQPSMPPAADMSLAVTPENPESLIQHKPKTAVGNTHKIPTEETTAVPAVELAGPSPRAQSQRREMSQGAPPFTQGVLHNISPSLLAEQKEEFTKEMQMRFLSGADAAHVDYRSIDADTTLDDDWIEQQSRDAEDRYFDSD